MISLYKNSNKVFAAKVFLAVHVLCVLFVAAIAIAPKQVQAIPEMLKPKCSAASCNYIFLAPISALGLGNNGSYDVSGAGANNYLVALYTFGIVLASGLALMMIVLGGAQYASSDAIQGKSDAKGKIQAAITGLILALLSYTILRTINPTLTTVSFSPSAIAVNTSNDQPAVVPIPGGGTGTGTGTGDPTLNPQTGTPNSSEAERMNATALGMLGKNTCDISGTGGGRLACAFVVNDIVNDALGKPITGAYNDEASYGRATSQMFNDLRSSSSFYYVGSGVSNIQPGDIIISPTQGGNTGHVGVYTSTGKIISNSSSRQSVENFYTPASWTNYYSGTKSLPVYIFRPGTATTQTP